MIDRNSPWYRGHMSKDYEPDERHFRFLRRYDHPISEPRRTLRDMLADNIDGVVCVALVIAAIVGLLVGRLP